MSGTNNAENDERYRDLIGRQGAEIEQLKAMIQQQSSNVNEMQSQLDGIQIAQPIQQDYQQMHNVGYYNPNPYGQQMPQYAQQPIGMPRYDQYGNVVGYAPQPRQMPQNVQRPQPQTKSASNNERYLEREFTDLASIIEKSANLRPSEADELADMVISEHAKTGLPINSILQKRSLTNTAYASAMKERLRYDAKQNNAEIKFSDEQKAEEEAEAAKVKEDASKQATGETPEQTTPAVEQEVVLEEQKKIAIQLDAPLTQEDASGVFSKMKEKLHGEGAIGLPNQDVEATPKTQKASEVVSNQTTNVPAKINSDPVVDELQSFAAYADQQMGKA